MRNTDLELISRTRQIFNKDWNQFYIDVSMKIKESRILVIGGAGSIGGTVTRILFDLKPRVLHVIDVNENGLADLVRDIRNTSGYLTDDFRTICFDFLYMDMDELIEKTGPYNVILNFSAIKHVRSEKDPFTLARMFSVNVQLMKKLTKWTELSGVDTLFSVSTDKAANPANLMGASKRLMEMVGFTYGNGHFSSARFANVAFSNGSLLKAFWDRLEKGQPLAAPFNIKRFFITHEEAAQLCLLGAFSAPKGTIAIPRAPGEVELTSFIDVAKNVLASRGYKPLLCDSEEEARNTKPTKKEWPCYFFESDTSGEKPYEEFIAEGEELIESPFEEISLIGKTIKPDISTLEAVLAMNPVTMRKEEVVELVSAVVPGFSHVEKGKNLDQRM